MEQMQQHITFQTQSRNAVIPIQATRSADFVRWGNNNNFPTELIEAVKNSPTQSSILNSLKTFVIGAGVNWEDGLEIEQPNADDSWDSIMYKIVSDYVLFEGFALQVVKNRGEGVTIYHQPFDEVRIGKVDEFGRNEEFVICSDWRRYSKKTSVTVKKFTSFKELKSGEVQLCYFKKTDCGEKWYHTPSYYSAINYILTDWALSEYYANITKNNFQPSAVFSFPNTPDTEQQKAIHDGIKESFCGSENAGAILCLFGEGGNEVKVSPFTPSSPDIYNNVSETILSNLVTANRLTSPTLAGIYPKSGFSSQSDLLITAYELYKLTVVDEHKRFILQSINSLLKNCGMADGIELEDYDIKSALGGIDAKNERIEDEVSEDSTNSVIND